MRPTTFATGLVAAGLLLSQAASAELVMTAPPQLIAGSGSTLLLRFDSLGDRDASTHPVAQVDGMAIRIDLNDECVHISCDVSEERLFRVDLPPLEEGDYTVTVYGLPVSNDVRGTFALAVGAPAALPVVLPVEGFWMPVGMPGTGLHLQHRGDLLAVSQFDQVQGDADWRLDAAPLHGDSAIVLLRGYAGGSCFGCMPHTAPGDAHGEVAMRLAFASARTATAELLDGTLLPLVNLPFGADYVDADFAPDDAASGPLALPDLAGQWAIPELRSDIITFGAAELLDDGTVRFAGTSVDHESIRIDCHPSGDSGSGCFLSDTLPSPPLLDIAFAPLGDVGEDRIRFATQDPVGVWYAVQVPDEGIEADSPVRPAEGFWILPGQPGTGMHFQHRGELLAVTQFDFIDGESHWRLGVAPLAAGAADVALHSYSGGSCFGCTPHVAPVADSDPPVATIAFDSARRATVDLGGDTVIPLVNLPFGADYVDAQLPGGGDDQFGPLALPDLSGTWAFDLDESVPGPRIVTLQAEYLVITPPPGMPDPLFLGFGGESSDGERFELACEPGSEVAPAGCELRIGDLAIGTPPPGWYPFARLGDIEENRIRFVGGPGGTDEGFRVFYAVRIPPAE